MEILRLVYLQWLSGECDKYVWEDRSIRSWDEIIGRIYLLKAHDEIEDKQYEAALADFEQALPLLAKDSISNDYYIHALADKAILHCFLGQYQTALATFRQALSLTPRPDDWIWQNYGSIFVLAGAFTDALGVRLAQLQASPDDEYQRLSIIF